MFRLVESWVSNELDEEFITNILEVMKAHTVTIPIALLITASLFIAIAWNYISSLQAIIWLSFFVGFAMLRRYCVLGKSIFAVYNPVKRLSIATICSGILGVLLCFVLLLFPYMNLHEQSVVTIIFMGLCVASVVSAAGYFPIFSSFAFPIFIALIARWLFMPEQHWLNYTLAVLLFIFAWILTRSSQVFFQFFQRSYLFGEEKMLLNQQLERALQEVKKSSLEKLKLFASAGHDLSQPLQSITYNIESLIRKSQDKETQKLLLKVQSSSESLSDQLGEILEISRIDAGNITPRVTAVRLNNIIEMVYSEFIQQTEEKKLKFTIRMPDDVLVMGDQNFLTRIIRNLVSNAVKYTHQGEIKLEVMAAKDNVVVEVSDTGIGIPDSKRKFIFGEFTQLENSSRDRSKGLGLGLAIVKRFVHLMDARIDMQSIEGVGSVFTLFLERLYLTEFNDDEYNTSIVEGLKILVVDDDETVGDAIATLLQNLGCEINYAVSFDKAIELAKVQEPDVVLTDYRLGHDVNGVMLIEALRKIYPEIPALIISGAAWEEDMVQVENHKLTILNKPVALANLLDSINHSLN